MTKAAQLLRSSAPGYPLSLPRRGSLCTLPNARGLSPACATGVSLAIGRNRCRGPAPSLRVFDWGSLAQSTAPPPEQSEASMAAAGAAATDLGARHSGWGMRLPDCERGTRVWGLWCARRPADWRSGVTSDRIPSDWGPGHGPRVSVHRLPGLLQVVGGVGTRARVPRLSLYSCTSRCGPRQACRPILRCGGHRAGAADLVEDHRDLPGPVALLRNQWAECPAGETSAEKGKGTAHPQGRDSPDGPGASSHSSGSWYPSLSCLPESRCLWTTRRSCPSPLCMRERYL